MFHRQDEAAATMLFLFLSLPLLAGRTRVTAAVFYVDRNHPSSSDINSGAATQPWATIQKAANTARPGDTVHVHAGTYHERVICRVSGAAGAPIVFEGQRGADGEWLTVVDGGDPTPAWTPAPEASPPAPYDSYTYKTVLAYEPYAMTVDGKDVPRLGWAPGSLYEGYTYLRYPPDRIVTTDYEGIAVNYWDGLDALYYPVYEANRRIYTVYLRFRNGDDPNPKHVRTSPAGAGFLIDGRSYITLRNFRILGAQNGVEIRGKEATHNIIEGNHITTGQKRLVLTAGAADNHIRYNEMFMNGLSKYSPGGWNGANRLPDESQRYQHGVKEHIYNVYKGEVGNGSTYSLDDDAGILVQSPGAGNAIYQNYIHDTLGGIDIFEVSHGLKVYGNTITNTSSIGISSGRNQFDVEIFDNLLCNSNGNFRMQDMDAGARRVYFYRNRLYNGHAIGDNMYFHWSRPNATVAETPEIWIYHNTFVGSCWGMTISSWAQGNAAAIGTYFVNNVYSPTPDRPLFGYVPGIFGVFDYNWAGGQHPSPLPAWFGAHNLLAEERQLWPDETLPDFRLPVDSDARNAGLNLSQPFLLDGTVYPALPGMYRGYFHGVAPDLGAVQDSAL